MHLNSRMEVWMNSQRYPIKGGIGTFRWYFKIPEIKELPLYSQKNLPNH